MARAGEQLIDRFRSSLAQQLRDGAFTERRGSQQFPVCVGEQLGQRPQLAV
jgi:hypothetical protein